MLNLIGWIGAICLAVSGIPQAYLSWKQGHSKGISSGLLWLWMIGITFTLVYVLFNLGFVAVLVLNYTLNIIFVGIIIKYKYWPRI